MNITNQMMHLKSSLQKFCLGLKKMAPTKVKKAIKGAGVYLFFDRNRLLRIGSSVNAPSRILSQPRDIRRRIIHSLADQKDIQVHQTCGHCGKGNAKTTDEFQKLEKSVDARILVGFVPSSHLEKFQMDIRQLEGLLLWAADPPLNFRSEISRLSIPSDKPSIWMG